MSSKTHSLEYRDLVNFTTSRLFKCSFFLFLASALGSNPLGGELFNPYLT